MNKTSENGLEERIKKIEARNRKVEQDKKWEVSWTRKLAITFLTYVLVTIYLFLIANSNPFINALIPAVGFLLSTLALGWLREFWNKNII